MISPIADELFFCCWTRSYHHHNSMRPSSASSRKRRWCFLDHTRLQIQLHRNAHQITTPCTIESMDVDEDSFLREALRVTAVVEELSSRDNAGAGVDDAAFFREALRITEGVEKSLPGAPLGAHVDDDAFLQEALRITMGVEQSLAKSSEAASRDRQSFEQPSVLPTDTRHVKCPWAREGSPAGRLVRAADSEKTKAYFCFECDAQVLLCKGEIIRPYFRHKTYCTSSNEGLFHKLAKLLICENIAAIQFEIECCQCHAPYKINPFSHFKQCMMTETIELRGAPCPGLSAFCEDGSSVPGFRFDVSVKDAGGALVGAVEVYNTSRVARGKSSDLTALLGQRWFEVDARSVVASGGRTAECVSTHHVCGSCKPCLGCGEIEPRCIIDDITDGLCSQCDAKVYSWNRILWREVKIVSERQLMLAKLKRSLRASGLIK